MRWTIWGTVLVLCCFAAGRAEAGVFDCHQDECTCAAPTYCASTPYYYSPSSYSPYMSGDCCTGYYDECEDECCLQRCWRRMCDLEHRKNSWLKRTFLGGCGDDDCYQHNDYYQPACGGVYYAPSAPGCCNGY